MLNKEKSTSGGAKEKDDVKKSECTIKWHEHKHSAWGGFYGLALIGAAVYYVQQVSGFWPTVLALLKACVWPAFLVYEVFVRLAM